MVGPTHVLYACGQQSVFFPSSFHPSTHLVEVEHQIKFTHIAEELIQHFDEEVDSFEVRQLVVIGVHTDAEEQPRVSTVDNLGASAEFDEIRLVFLISWCDETMDLSGR